MKIKRAFGAFFFWIGVMSLMWGCSVGKIESTLHILVPITIASFIFMVIGIYLVNKTFEEPDDYGDSNEEDDTHLVTLKEADSIRHIPYTEYMELEPVYIKSTVPVYINPPIHV